MNRNISICILIILCHYHTNCIIINNRLRRSNIPQHTHSLAFKTIDIIKIFGRITNKSLIGDVLTSNLNNVNDREPNGKLRWQLLFEEHDEKLTLDQFKKNITNLQFFWPYEFVTNRQLPYLMPKNLRKNYKLKCTNLPLSGTHLTDYLGKAEDVKNVTEQKLLELSKIIDGEDIAPDALDAVFEMLTNNEEKLTEEHISAFINYKSPLLEMVNWRCFITSLSVGPENND